jgi:hypothetical protein
MKDEAAKPRHTAAQSNPVKPNQTGSNPIKPGQTQSNRIKPNQTGSNPIKPDQTQSNRIKPNQTGSNPVKPDQTQSNRIKPAGRLACPEIGQSNGERGRRTAARSKAVKLVKLGQTKSSYSSTETEQQKICPLCGLSRPSEFAALPTSFST